MKKPQTGRIFRSTVLVIIVVSLLSQGVLSFAADRAIGNEFDFSRLFYNTYKTDSGRAILNNGGTTLSLTGLGSMSQTKSMLTSESAYSAIKAFMPCSFSIDYYFFSNGQIRAELIVEQTSRLRQAETAARQVFARIISPGMSDTEKVKAIHDYIVLNCEYDYNAIDNYSFAPYSYYGVFINKKAVCSGYADAFKLLCDMADIPSLIVCGTASNSTDTMPHAWNMVCLNGSWYYVDSTFDDPYPDRKNTVIWDYFLIDYETISVNHYFDEEYYFILAEYLNTASPQAAARLNSLGLFQGTGKGFDLDRMPTRAETAVMLVRLLGKEAEATDPANGYADATPFNDLPYWAAGHIGYLYANGITVGISENKFGSNNAASLSQYLTFLLRVLGYEDGYDFVWNDSSRLAQQIGLISNYKIAAASSHGFLRADLADISVAALGRPYKGESFTLADKLMEAGIFSAEQARSVGI